ncbi:hypothetical protein GCM10027278_27760 [Paralcaligenes ginsengisoli]
MSVNEILALQNHERINLILFIINDLYIILFLQRVITNKKRYVLKTYTMNKTRAMTARNSLRENLYSIPPIPFVTLC